MTGLWSDLVQPAMSHEEGVWLHTHRPHCVRGLELLRAYYQGAMIILHFRTSPLVAEQRGPGGGKHRRSHMGPSQKVSTKAPLVACFHTIVSFIANSELPAQNSFEILWIRHPKRDFQQEEGNTQRANA